MSEKTYSELELAKAEAELALLHRRVENMREGCASTQPPQGEPLIQGYTAEQWQEIIDGGYLCEFACEGGFCIDELDSLERIVGGDVDKKFRSKRIRFLSTSCRPAQIKGVVRPIFVEPVDNSGIFHFFTKDGGLIGFSNDFDFHPKTENTAKYIEL